MSDINRNVPRSEADVANSGPAPWVNKFMAMLGPMVKIVFLEQGGAEEPLYFRSAVTMSHQDAVALKNLLTQLLADIEKQRTAQEKPQQSESPSDA